MLICKAGTGSCDQTNADGHTVTVKLLSNNICNGIACVSLGTRGVATHSGDLELILQEPAWRDGYRYRWTDVVDLHFEPVDGYGNEFWVHVGTTMIHEFGHTLGLVHEVPTPSVMAESWNYTNIGRTTSTMCRVG